MSPLRSPLPFDALRRPAAARRRRSARRRARRRRAGADRSRRSRRASPRRARSRARQPASRSSTASELSVTWEWRHGPRRGAGHRSRTTSTLAAGLAGDSRAAATRARGASARRSRSAGIPGAFEGASAYVTSERLISRTHFARFLVETGHARDMKDAFKRYLRRASPATSRTRGRRSREAVGWIHARRRSGGHRASGPLQAHRVGACGALLAEFRDLGGDAIEVVSPSHTPAQFAEFAALARMLRPQGVVRLRLPRPRRKPARSRRPAAAARGRRPVWITGDELAVIR